MSKVTTVLIIDDSEDDRYIYRRFLEHGAQYEVYEATNSQSGLRLAETLSPDCILLDLNLQGESGYELLAHLVGLERPPKRTVIILTGLGRQILEQGALALGATGFLVKSKIDAAALDVAIQQAIKKTAAR
jgi:CheY-like chemotaxis protein